MCLSAGLDSSGGGLLLFLGRRETKLFFRKSGQVTVIPLSFSPEEETRPENNQVDREKRGG